MTSTTRAGQSLFDIAVQETGRVELAFELATVNQLSLTDSMQAGVEVSTAGLPVAGDLQERIKQIGLRPATGIVLPMAARGGIGVMTIATTFRMALPDPADAFSNANTIQ